MEFCQRRSEVTQLIGCETSDPYGVKRTIPFWHLQIANFRNKDQICDRVFCFRNPSSSQNDLVYRNDIQRKSQCLSTHIMVKIITTVLVWPSCNLILIISQMPESLMVTESRLPIISRCVSRRFSDKSLNTKAELWTRNR